MEPLYAPELRSLTIGEIFDRATTLYVRNFVVFTLIVLTLLAPSAIVRYLLIGNRTAAEFTQILTAIQHPGQASPVLALAQPLFVGIFAISLLTLLLAPYVNNAVAVCVAMIYQGEQPSYVAAFRRVFARGWPLLGTILLCALLLLGLYVALAFAWFIVAALLGSLLGSVGSAGVVLVAFIIAGGLLFFATMILAVVACIFALYATTLEGEGATKAISQAFGRIFNRSEFGKALLLTLAYAALELIAVIVTGGIGFFIESVLHVTPLDLAFTTIAAAILNAFVTTILAVYYFDVRTRVEGFDLEVDLARLAPS